MTDRDGVPPPADTRLLTGIPGLDMLLSGGLPANRLHLIEGDPGTGKTTLALQFLLEGRAKGESCLYVTLSETANELRGIAASHGWSLDGINVLELARAEGSAEQYTLYHPSEIELGDMVRSVLDATDRLRPTRVVLDSLSEMRLLAREPLRYRRQILSLKEYFSTRDTTVLLLDDRTSGEHDLQLQSLAHGVVRLEQTPFDYGRARRRMRIIKIRGVAATEGFHDFKIARGGLVVYPQLVPRTEGARVPTAMRSGIAELDSLLGGGVSRGTCTLFLGPAGVGKSTVAAQYAMMPDVPAAAFLFDERRATFVDRCHALGMKVKDRLASGGLRIEQIEPGELSPGEFAHRVRDCVDRENCRVVLIDSLNGYLNAIPSGHSPLVRMHELIAYLNERNVVTLLIMAQHGMMGTQMPVPLDVSYLADAVVMLRYFEADGMVRKAISVVKKRTGSHETSIREFVVGPGGVRLGEPLTQFQGVMSGVPTYRGNLPLMRNDGTNRG